MSLDLQPTLRGDGLTLAPLAEADLPALAAAMRDPGIWEQHPVKERGTAEGSEAYARWLLGAGGALVARDGAGRIIGTSRFYVTGDLPPGAVAIGYTFLVRDHWGGVTNGHMKSLMLDHLFTGADEAWFHIGPENLRSQRAAAKIGATPRPDGPDMLDGKPFPHRTRFAITRAEWLERRASSSG